MFPLREPLALAFGVVFEQLPFVGIGSADFDVVEIVQNVQFGDRQASHAVEAYRFADSNGIKPTTAARAACGRTELMPGLGECRACFIVQLCWEWPFTNSCAVSFGDADNTVDVTWCNTGAGADATSAGRR